MADGQMVALHEILGKNLLISILSMGFKECLSIGCHREIPN